MGIYSSLALLGVLCVIGLAIVFGLRAFCRGVTAIFEDVTEPTLSAADRDRALRAPRRARDGAGSGAGPTAADLSALRQSYARLDRRPTKGFVKVTR